jgi:hypothetical protein
MVKLNIPVSNDNTVCILVKIARLLNGNLARYKNIHHEIGSEIPIFLRRIFV